jgi:hypothetical protein
VVYYTSNREEEKFESRIRRNLLATINGDAELISVSQKPLDFGTNICVGDVGTCDLNAIRQLQIGILEAKTPYITVAEADCLYPPDYFNYIPPTKKDCYRYTNVWVLHSWIGRKFGGGYRRKEFSECAQFAGRDYWLYRIEKALNGFPYWGLPGEPNPPLVFSRHGWKPLERSGPYLAVINMKTLNGLRKFTRTPRAPEYGATELPYWGKAQDMREDYFRLEEGEKCAT